MDMTVLFQALADPRRREIVELLRDGERSVGELVHHLPIAQSGVSRHLRILKEAGVVRVRGRGQQRLYALEPAPFEALDQWLGRYRQLWEDRMDAFGAALDRRMLNPGPVPQLEDDP